MLDQQQSLYSGFDAFISMHVVKDKGWVWRIHTDDNHLYYSEIFFKSAADAEQDLITFLKNKII